MTKKSLVAINDGLGHYTAGRCLLGEEEKLFWRVFLCDLVVVVCILRQKRGDPWHGCIPTCGCGLLHVEQCVCAM